MMKKIFAASLGLLSLALITSCGGTGAKPAPGTVQEFDYASGSWKPLQKSISAPPPQGGAVIVEEKKPGMLSKIGKTVKAPLKWVGLAKDEEQPAPATPAPAKKDEKKTQQ